MSSVGSVRKVIAYINCKMQLLTIIFAILSCFKLSQCGEVCGKNIVNNKSFPWDVGIYMEGTGTQMELVCFGTIVKSYIILTAARCLCDRFSGKLNEKSLFIAPGKIESFLDKSHPNLQKINRKNVFLQPEYAGETSHFDCDIAVVKLDKELSFNAEFYPACVDWSNFIEGNENDVGKQTTWYQSGTKQVDLPCLEFESCVSLSYKLMWKEFVTADKMCTKANGFKFSDKDGGAGLCFLNSEDNLWYIRGVLSSHDRNKDKLTVYTKISRYINWISSTLIKLSLNR